MQTLCYVYKAAFALAHNGIFHATLKLNSTFQIISAVICTISIISAFFSMQCCCCCTHLLFMLP